ncbi:hypothetical protein DEVEQU_02445 [Devosia equisanguinis]|uniref:DUF4214 domain-containing protein n=1 Tax=Devosia equisanguinis TaxID=2490941 RepID=A0A447ICW4_9HYPH|nr:DUF4214 domain-containing protein [Devosia equisanguinis]VDS05304.1 hypothetical protein DEVEQU_02445 [Devosia equisanguinis]
MTTINMTIGDLKGFIDLSKAMVGGLVITDFGALFDKIEQLLRGFGQWTPELEANMALAKEALLANPGLFDIGKATFVSSVDELLAKYPADTLLSDIPEFSGDGGGTGLPPVTSYGDIDIAKILAVFADVNVNYDKASGIVSVDGAGYAYKLPDVERLEFNDGFLAFDFDGPAGQLVRLYKAALDRDADFEGLGYWIRHQDNKLSSLADVADSFMASPEFLARFRTEATVSDADFIALLYKHTLGRVEDKEGFDYWVGKLEAGETNRKDLLVFFSESDENKANALETYADGIWYL